MPTSAFAAGDRLEAFVDDGVVLIALADDMALHWLVSLWPARCSAGGRFRWNRGVRLVQGRDRPGQQLEEPRSRLGQERNELIGMP